MKSNWRPSVPCPRCGREVFLLARDPIHVERKGVCGRCVVDVRMLGGRCSRRLIAENSGIERDRVAVITLDAF